MSEQKHLISFLFIKCPLTAMPNWYIAGFSPILSSVSVGYNFQNLPHLTMECESIPLGNGVSLVLSGMNIREVIIGPEIECRLEIIN